MAFEINGELMEFRHLHILRRLVLQTCARNFKANYSFAKAVIASMPEDTPESKQKAAADLLARIEKLADEPMSAMDRFRRGEWTEGEGGGDPGDEVTS